MGSVAYNPIVATAGKPNALPEPPDPRFSRVFAGALAVVTNAAGQLLMVKQAAGPFAGAWLLPGGRLERGEGARAAVRREVLEETGIAVEGFAFVRTYEVRGRWAEGSYDFVMLAFKATSEVPVAADFAGHNVHEARWMFPTEVDLHPTNLRILADAGVHPSTEAEIAASLDSAGITMDAYP